LCRCVERKLELVVQVRSQLVQPLPPSNFIAGDDSTLFEDGFGWKAVAIGYGCGLMFGVIMGYVVFKTRRPAWFLKMVEDQWSLNAS